ncbi:calpain-A isoform X1 [Aedes aegypti]|uniref:Uncharacterized protein n=1 Tax=Aedes aegypti TaxID=7159 RepID=A0A6I8T6N1_AEDAE|nr:calpain-A isoform X1 [Aedes aegypti]
MEVSCDQSNGLRPNDNPLSKFLVVEFTDDNIFYNSNTVPQNPNAQDFYQLKQQLQANKSLFEDPDFPASNHTVLGHDSQSNIQWVRPPEINPKPKFFCQAPPEYSIEKRSVLHSFLSTTLTCLSTNHEALLRTVPSDNSFEGKLYRGLFHFRFWQYGRWLDVVIDDRLPTMDGKLLFIRPTTQNEFWCALLEKAYAKLCGSYSAIASRNLIETMQDFTGGISERYYLGSAVPVADACYETISCKLEKGSLMAAIKMNDNRGSSKHSQHSYSILKAVTIESKMFGLQTPVEELIEMNYLRSGTMSLPADCYRKSWLRIDEFIKNYDFVDICNISPNQMGQPLSEDYSWQLSCIEGSWVSGSTAGGSKDDLKSFWTNPQYLLQLTHPDEIDNSGSCHVVILLMQKLHDTGYHPISFVVFQIPDEDFRTKTIPMSYSKKKLPKIIAHPTFSNAREVTGRVRISPSTLLIVPCTQKRNVEGDFFLRIYSKPHRKDVQVSSMPCTMGTNWSSIVRMFYSFSDTLGTIDHAALASILDAHFFTFKSKSKHKSSLWKALTRKRSKLDDPNKSIDESREEFLQHLAQTLASAGQATDTIPERLNYDKFKRIIRNVQHWKEMFDFYDPDRKGYVDRKKLIVQLKSSSDSAETTSSLLQWLEMEQDDKVHLEEFIYYSLQNNPTQEMMQLEMMTLLSSQMFTKMAR